MSCAVEKHKIQTIVGWVACMSCFQPDAWCHQTKLKRQGYGQVTVILAANIIPIGVRYMKNKICLCCGVICIWHESLSIMLPHA